MNGRSDFRFNSFLRDGVVHRIPTPYGARKEPGEYNVRC